MRQEIRRQLEQSAEAGYKAFSEKLLPGRTDILGVRLPVIRKIAKQTADENAQAFLAEMQAADWHKDAYFEEKMLYGLVIGCAKMSREQHRSCLDQFVPLIDNWSVCDSCCSAYRWMRSDPQYWRDYLLGWTAADTEYGIRFGLVCILDHFTDEAHLQEIFQICSRIQNEGYYAKMAQAWLLSVCFTVSAEETYAFLEKDSLDHFTHHKTIQKICESYRVSDEWKARVRTLRRKGKAVAAKKRQEREYD